ncbi:MAG: ankyrin repeat domain-containing protein [Proteobacteria bacterium]|nr:ankyrin repeat domain-containing protein [Pseudomonadota bacterium]
MDKRQIAILSIILFGWTGAATAGPEPIIADAAEAGDVKLILRLLLEGADQKAPQADGMTALHWAVYNDDLYMAALLVGAGADVNAVNRYGVPPLSLACTNGNADLVRGLLSSGADPNGSLRGGETVLMTAARTGNLEVVEALLAEGADPGARERRDQTALMWAAAEGHADVVRALIGAGAEFRSTLKSGFTPMFFAVREGRMDVVRTLLDAGIDVNETMNGRGRGVSPLLLAVQNGHFELAVALLNAGADPNDQRSGYTSLHTLVHVRKPNLGDAGDPAPIGSGNMTSLQFARTLVAMGADINARLEKGVSRAPGLNKKGATPFFVAADRADASYMRLLLELGADPFLPNVEHSTPLMAAAGLGTLSLAEEAGTEPEAVEAVKVLLDLGADVNALDDNGETPMHGAAYGIFPKIVQLLADNKADIGIWNRTNKHGWTPLFIAEGYRPGNALPSAETIKSLRRIMGAAGVSTDGPRPRKINESYEKKKVSPKAPPGQKS